MAGVDHQQCRFRACRPGNHVLDEFAMAGRVDDDVVAQLAAKPDLRGIYGDALVALRLKGIHQKGPLKGHAPALAHRLDGLQLAVRQRARVVEQAAHQRRLAVIDMADDDDAKRFGPRRRGRGMGGHYMYPAARKRSKASSVSRSMARPARSGAVVSSSSAMISSNVAALLAIGEVMSESPSER